MKYYKIEVEIRGSITSVFSIVSCDEVDEYTGTTPYNHFDTLRDAKRYALDHQPSMHHSDHRGWRYIIKRTTMEEIWLDHFDVIADTEGGYNFLAEENTKLKAQLQEYAV